MKVSMKIKVVMTDEESPRESVQAFEGIAAEMPEFVASAVEEVLEECNSFYVGSITVEMKQV